MDGTLRPSDDVARKDFISSNSFSCSVEWASLRKQPDDDAIQTDADARRNRVFGWAFISPEHGTSLRLLKKIE